MTTQLPDDAERFNAVDPRTHPGVELLPDALVGRVDGGPVVVTVGQQSDDPRRSSVKVWREGAEIDLVSLELTPDEALQLAELLLRAART
jgi:hypothetical protein